MLGHHGARMRGIIPTPYPTGLLVSKGRSYEISQEFKDLCVSVRDLRRHESVLSFSGCLLMTLTPILNFVRDSEVVWFSYNVYIDH